MSEVLSTPVVVYPMAVTDRALWDALMNNSPGFFQAVHDERHDTWTITPMDPPAILDACAPRHVWVTVEDEHTAWIFNTWAEATLAGAAFFYCAPDGWKTLHFVVV